MHEVKLGLNSPHSTEPIAMRKSYNRKNSLERGGRLGSGMRWTFARRVRYIRESLSGESITSHYRDPVA